MVAKALISAPPMRWEQTNRNTCFCPQCRLVASSQGCSAWISTRWLPFEVWENVTARLSHMSTHTRYTPLADSLRGVTDRSMQRGQDTEGFCPTLFSIYELYLTFNEGRTVYLPLFLLVQPFIVAHALLSCYLSGL